MFSDRFTSCTRVNNRSAFNILNISKKCSGKVEIEKNNDNRRVDCKSLLGLLSLGIDIGDKLVIIYDKDSDIEFIEQIKHSV